MEVNYIPQSTMVIESPLLPTARKEKFKRVSKRESEKKSCKEDLPIFKRATNFRCLPPSSSPSSGETSKTFNEDC